MGYHLTAKKLAELQNMIAAGKTDKEIASLLGISRPSVFYRRKQLKEQGVVQFRDPDLVRRVGGVKSHVRRAGAEPPQTEEVVRALEAKGGPGSVVQLRPRGAGLAGADDTPAPVRPVAKRKNCLSCGKGFETTDPRNQHLCTPCRHERAIEGNPFGNFVLYG